MCDRPAVRTDPLVFLPAGVLEAVSQAGAVPFLRVEKIRSDPYHISLIRLARTDFRLMDILVVGEEDIAGAEQVCTSLNVVRDIAGEKEVNFIKLMFVKIPLGRYRVQIMLAFKIRSHHSLMRRRKFVPFVQIGQNITSLFSLYLS